ncbi:MAG: hypothetical protein KF833_24020 [Verrucomicrobiae bacterium]|nr:hypothetical protein [Verrucomicrobiae bacterium]
MPAATNIVELRRMLGERFPEAHRARRPGGAPPWPTGVPALDAVLGGGLVRGGLTELVGTGPGSGSAQVLHALLARTVADGGFLALIDGADSFDADAPTERELARLLWVRCGKAEEALKAADVVLRDRNLPCVVLDLKMNPASELRRIPSSVWHRLGRIAEHQGTSLLVVTPWPMVGAVGVRVEARSGLGIEALREEPAMVLARLRFGRLREAAGRTGAAAVAG